jgi:hypothetical protein
MTRRNLRFMIIVYTVDMRIFLSQASNKTSKSKRAVERAMSLTEAIRIVRRSESARSRRTKKVIASSSEDLSEDLSEGSQDTEEIPESDGEISGGPGVESSAGRGSSGEEQYTSFFTQDKNRHASSQEF